MIEFRVEDDSADIELELGWLKGEDRVSLKVEIDHTLT